MPKQNIITIDLSQYVTQAEYARINDIKLGTVSQWIKRMKAGQSTPIKLDYLEIPELSLTLVKR